MPIPRPLARRAVQGSSITREVSPPIRGWNTRVGLDNMPPESALQLDNWFPRQTDVIVRTGFTEHCDTAEAVAVRGLHAHSAGGTEHLIAIADGVPYNVTVLDTPTSFTAPSTFTTDEEIYSFMFGGLSWFCSGAEAPRTYDGTVTGFDTTGLLVDVSETQAMDSAKFMMGMGFKSRIYFIERDLLGFWYGGVTEITGAVLEYFPLDHIMPGGGSIIACGSFSDDTAGTGLGDFSVFISSEGYVAVFSGSDPGDATDYAIVGIWHIGEPINRFCMTKFGADNVVVTRSGYVSLTSVLKNLTQRSTRFALSDNIGRVAQDVFDRHNSNKGWRGIVFPKRSMLFINVPTTAAASNQHVMNTVTGAWCRFTGIQATDFAVFGDELYFGHANGKVYKYDDGNTDDGVGVTAIAKTAWNTYGIGGRRKKFNLVQPIFVSDSNPFIQIGFAVDFEDYNDTGAVQASVLTGTAQWDVSIWDTAIWGGVSTATTSFVSLGGIGYAGSMRVVAAENDSALSWQSNRVVLQPGGVL